MTARRASTATTSPRPRQPQRKARGDYHHGNLRSALIDAAVVLISEHGVAGFTLREAARLVGVDHRAAYRHFADRDAVLAAVAEQGYRDLHRLVTEALVDAGPSIRTRLLTIARVYVRFAFAEPGRYQVLAGPHNYLRFPTTDTAVDDAFAILVTEIERGCRRRELVNGDVTELAAWFWSTMHGLADLILSRRVRVRRELLDGFTDRMIGRGLSGVLRKAT
ncbi:MAG: TetR/AcrR family transcriptional regulator [Kofleriaceae bacterium]